VFDQAGGIDERFGAALFDVDYCLRVRRLGQRVLCTPLAELTWGEAARGARVERTDREAPMLVETWKDADRFDDPYLNRHVLWPNPLSLRLD
jgi:O-antigen biosynthesis protein